jgi:hypothetical protein
VPGGCLRELAEVGLDTWMPLKGGTLGSSDSKEDRLCLADISHKATPPKHI